MADGTETASRPVPATATPTRLPTPARRGLRDGWTTMRRPTDDPDGMPPPAAITSLRGRAGPRSSSSSSCGRATGPDLGDVPERYSDGTLRPHPRPPGRALGEDGFLLVATRGRRGLALLPTPLDALADGWTPGQSLQCSEAPRCSTRLAYGQVRSNSARVLRPGRSRGPLARPRAFARHERQCRGLPGGLPTLSPGDVRGQRGLHGAPRIRRRGDGRSRKGPGSGRARSMCGCTPGPGQGPGWTGSSATGPVAAIPPLGRCGLPPGEYGGDIDGPGVRRATMS